MAIPTIAIGSAAAGGNVDVTPTLPAHQADDWLYVDIECDPSPTSDITCPTAGWNEAADSPQEVTAGTVGCRITTFCKLATSSSETNPTFQGNTNHKYAVAWRVRGAKTTGEGVDVTAGGNGGTTASTTLSIPGDTTTGPDRLIVNSCARGFDSAAAQFSSEADVTLANLAELHDAGTAVGNGGGIGIWSGEKATAGAYGPMTATLANNSGKAFVSRAFEPLASGATGTVAVTQDAQTSAATAAETFAATSAATQDAQTPTASGSVLNPATGSAAVTQDDQTAAATGLETITGTVAVIQADQTSSAAGAETITGTAAPTQADQTSTATGVFGSAASGTAAVTQDDQTSTASGTVVVVISGSAAVTQADQTSTATAVETFAGTSANVQADQGSAATGVLGIAGSSATTQDDQTSTATGTALLAVTGTVAVTQQDQFSTATGIGGILTFWSANPAPFTTAPVSHTKAPVAFVPVGGGDDPPW